MALLKTVISGVQPTTHHSRVVNAIGWSIVSGEYRAGEALPNDAELCGRFGVSRTVLREAMKTLAAKGLVLPRPKTGTSVTDRRLWNMLDADILTWLLAAGGDTDGTIGHVFEMRLCFEPAAARLAAQRATEEEIAGLFAIADRMAPPHSNESFALVDLEFHSAILEAARNPLMYAIGSLIEAALALIFQSSAPAADDRLTERVARAHRAIVEAIAARDEDAADAAMREVIVIGRERVG